MVALQPSAPARHAFMGGAHASRKDLGKWAIPACPAGRSTCTGRTTTPADRTRIALDDTHIGGRADRPLTRYVGCT